MPGTLTVNLSALDLRYGRLRARERRREARMLASVEERGQLDPIIVVGEGEGRYVVIDGHKRVRALKRLRRDVAKAAVWELEPAEALVAAYRAGRGGGYNAIEEGWLVHELHRVGRRSLVEVAAAMERSRSWASRRLGLVEGLPEGVLEGVRRGELGAWLAMKHLLPLARANVAACERLAGKIVEAGLSSRQTALVCAHFGSGGQGKAAARILEDPARFLKALEAAKQGAQDLALSEGENRCVKNLDLIGNVSWGLVGWLPKVVGCETGEAAWDKLRQAWERAQAGFRSLERTIAALGAATKGGSDARSTDADGDLKAQGGGSRQPQDRPGPRGQPHQRAGGDSERAGAGA